MDTILLQRFVVLADELELTRAAALLGISRMTLNTSVKKIEDEIGSLLFDRAPQSLSLTAAGRTLLAETRREQAKPAPASVAPVRKPGGKAKASKGVGRAPAVKGQPRQGKRRQSR